MGIREGLSELGRVPGRSLCDQTSRCAGLGNIHPMNPLAGSTWEREGEITAREDFQQASLPGTVFSEVHRIWTRIGQQNRAVGFKGLRLEELTSVWLCDRSFLGFTIEPERLNLVHCKLWFLFYALCYSCHCHLKLC